MRPRIRLREVLLLATLGAMVFGYCSVVIRGWSTAIVSHLEFSPDGRKLAAVFNRGKVEIWDLSDARPRRAAETQLAPRSTCGRRSAGPVSATKRRSCTPSSGPTEPGHK